MQRTRRSMTWIAFAALAATVGCAQGRSYTTGVVRHEKLNVGLFDFRRDERRESWSLFCEPFATLGTTAAGNYYTDFFAGGITLVNIPGLTMLVVYPFQYFDQPPELRHVFGVGSGEGDLRISLLWGFFSFGRNWNLFWMNGFWVGKSDPMYPPAGDAAKAFFQTIARPEDTTLGN